RPRRRAGAAALAPRRAVRSLAIGQCLAQRRGGGTALAYRPRTDDGWRPAVARAAMGGVSCDRKRRVERRTGHHGRDRAARKIGAMSMKRAPSDDRRAGFTLIEALAALAVGSVIIMATAVLIHDVARHFDRGTRGAQEAERLMIAVERLAQDFNSARFVGRTAEGRASVAFTG